MDLRDIVQEVKVVISGYIERGVDQLHPDWITTDIMNKHSDIAGDDADFAIIGCRAFVRNEVRKGINKIKDSDIYAPEQLIMEGFDYLQKYYAIERDGESCAVRIDCATDEELRAKAAEYMKMSVALAAHADEIYRYLAARSRASTG